MHIMQRDIREYEKSEDEETINEVKESMKNQ